MAADRRAAATEDAAAVAALAAALDERFGLAVPQGDAASLAHRLRHRIAERALEGLAAYVEYLIYGAGEEVWDALAETLTANESRVFEAPTDFLPLFELAVEPRYQRYARGAAGCERFRALSAGSGTGEEAYSLAIALAEAANRVPEFSFEVVGVDLSTHAIAAARCGVYAPSRFESLPPELRERHLVPVPGGLSIGSLRRTTRFARANLAEAESLRPLGEFDLVFARGVLPALTPGRRPVALANLAACLKAGGVLLLGPHDSMEGASHGLLPIRWGGRHAYERTGPAGANPLPAEDREPEPATAVVAHRSPLTRTWLRLLLEQRGVRVEEACDGIGALTLAVRGRAHATYLLERTLPSEGGPAVAARLLEMGAATTARIRLLSPRAEGRGTEAPAGDPRVAPLPLTDAELESLLGATES
jgi:chemotaxis methyl-accepting protein methylase